MDNNKPTAIFLIGAPGSGKSTYSVPFLRMGYTLISSDYFIEQIAKREGKTYTDVFKDATKDANAHIDAAADIAIASQEFIVWDQTNMSAKTRKPKVDKLFKAGYNVIAVAFEIARDELDRRLTHREHETGKHIPGFVIASMLSNYERPTTDEGFVEVSIVTG